ncbi:MAG: hypothetical protein LBS16_03090, partial [Prevotellaceae bacterium]|nr:hypothetical protein [Prevotellaceae bacterium]
KSGSTTKYEDKKTGTTVTGSKETTASAGEETVDEYDTNNNLTSSTIKKSDGTTEVTTYVYDAQNRQTEVHNPDGSWTKHEYDTYGNLYQTSDYSTAGTANLTSQSTTGYDAYHNTLSSTRFENGFTTSSSTEFTTNGNYQTSATDELGNTTYTEYNPLTGNLSNSTDAKGVVTTYEYDDLDRLISVSIPNNGTTITQSYNYTPAGKQEGITRNGFSYGFTYDNYGNPLTTSVAGSVLVTNTYKPNNGLLEKSTYGSGTNVQFVKFEYNNDEQVSEVKVGIGTSEPATRYTYIYNSEGGLIEINDLYSHLKTKFLANGSTEIYDTTISPAQKKIAYYSEAGADENSSVFVEEKYDKKIRHTSSSNEEAKTSGYAASLDGSVQYSRQNQNDILNRKSTETSYLGSTTASMTNTYAYQGGTERVASETIAYNTTSVYTYSYDENGNITQVNKNGSVWQQYYYDALGQLRRANDIYIYQSIFYTYDIGGNLTKIKRYYYNEGDYALGVGDFMNEDNFTYATSGWKDTLTSFNSKDITYDTAGNPLTYGTWEMEWTAGRRLKRVDSNVATKGSLDFTYNENGLRTSKTLVYTNNGIETTEVTKYDWINGKLMSQSKPYMTLFFFYDGEELVGCSDGTNSYVYEKNLQGDVLGLIDNTGAKVVEYKYSPYGDTLRTYAAENSWDLAYANPFRYRSYIQDSDFTGWYYCQSRYYVPQWGRFLNADSTEILSIAAEIPNDNNQFAYCKNNSIMRSDSTGHKSYTVNTVKGKDYIGTVIIKLWYGTITFTLSSGGNGNIRMNMMTKQAKEIHRAGAAKKLAFAIKEFYRDSHNNKPMPLRTINGLALEFEAHYIVATSSLNSIAKWRLKKVGKNSPIYKFWRHFEEADFDCIKHNDKQDWFLFEGVNAQRNYYYIITGQLWRLWL